MLSFVADALAVLLVSANITGAAAISPAVTPIGEFSNMRVQSEHCTGYSLQLWKMDDNLYGLFEACNGLAGDTPTGTLENVKWNPASGDISWKAKLTLGSDVLASGHQVPSQDEFSFVGSLKNSVITGKLTARDLADPDTDVTTARISLKERTEQLHAYQNLEELNKAMSAVLKVRGPQW